MSGAEANRTTAGDLPQTQAHFKLKSKNFFDLAHGQSPGWQADPPFRGGGCLPLCCPARLSACGNHSGEAEHNSAVGLKLFGFIAESTFTFIPESCSRSSRNSVRNQPGIAFILPRIPHEECRRLNKVYLGAIERNNEAASATASFYAERWQDTWHEEMKQLREACEKALEALDQHRREHGW
jgi:hypothetical protein